MATTRPLTQRHPLNDRQRRFVGEYLKDLNATAAYKRAGYEGDDNVCAVEGARLLRNPKVAEAIGFAQYQRAKRLHVKTDSVLHELVLLYSSDITHYVITDTGDVELAPHAPRDAMRAVSRLKKRVIHTDTGTTYETEITLWNKPAALKMGGEHLGLFNRREDKGQDISELLKAVLLELPQWQDARPVLNARYETLAPGAGMLPPPPAPEEMPEPRPW